MILNKEAKTIKQIEIDLTGPEGNAFLLLEYATRLSKQLGLNTTEIIEKMKSLDYENLLIEFDNYFGDYVILYR